MSIHNYTFGPPRGGWPEFDENGRIRVKSERTAVVVLGPEASGTRMMTEFCIRGGYFGDSKHAQRLDNLKFASAPDRIVFRRSLPHSRKWPNLLDIHSRLEKANYTTIHYVFTFRELARLNKDTTIFCALWRTVGKRFRFWMWSR